MTLALIMAGFLAAAAPTSPLESARARQDRAALEKAIEARSAEATKSPGDAGAQYRLALACSYLAEVSIEQHDKKAARAVAERGIKAAEKAVALNASDAESYRVLGTLYGQAITDLMSGLSYGPKAKEAIRTAVEKAPNSSEVYVARGVGNFYLPAQLGGGPRVAIPDFQKAIQLDPKSAEAYLWLGIALRESGRNAEARNALAKSLQLEPARVWAKQQLDKTPAK
jgi:tetratricopeptide (TPR) repeat protein